MRMLCKRMTHRMALLGAILLSTVLGLSGCSDSGQNQDDAINDVTRDNAIVVNVSGQGVSAALAAVPQAAAAQADSAQPRVIIQPRTVNCTQGSAEVAGDVRNTAANTTFDLQIDFNNCNNLNGILAVDGTAQSSGSNIGFTAIFDGTVTGECTLIYTNFTIALTSNNTAISVTIDGQLDAACGTTTVSCDFIEVNTADQNALENSCS